MEFKSREEWLQWRKDKIGSSDAPIVLNESKYKTPYQLYQEKIDHNFESSNDNDFIKNCGHRSEERVRELFNTLMNDEFNPCIVVMEHFPFIHASLDGRSKKNPKVIVEFKLMGNGGKAAINKPELQKWNQAKTKGIIPKDYWIQMQHQLMVSQADFCFFAAYLYDKDDKMLNKAMDSEKLAVLEVSPDKEFQRKLLNSHIAFKQCLNESTPPDKNEKDLKKERRTKK